MLRKPGKELPALYGGILMALICNIPGLNLINCLCCAGIMLGGFLGVMFYKNEFTPEMPPFTSGDCLTVGGLSGLVGAVIGTVLWSIIQALFGGAIMEFLIRSLKDINMPELTPYIDQIIKNADATLTVAAVLVQLLTNLVLDIIFGALGGLIAFNIFKPKNLYMPPPMYQQPPQNPPPPPQVGG